MLNCGIAGGHRPPLQWNRKDIKGAADPFSSTSKLLCELLRVANQFGILDVGRVYQLNLMSSFSAGRFMPFSW